MTFENYLFSFADKLFAWRPFICSKLCIGIESWQPKKQLIYYDLFIYHNIRTLPTSDSNLFIYCEINNVLQTSVRPEKFALQKPTSITDVCTFLNMMPQRNMHYIY